MSRRYRPQSADVRHLPHHPPRILRAFIRVGTPVSIIICRDKAHSRQPGAVSRSRPNSTLWNIATRQPARRPLAIDRGERPNGCNRLLSTPCGRDVCIGPIRVCLAAVSSDFGDAVSVSGHLDVPSAAGHAAQAPSTCATRHPPPVQRVRHPPRTPTEVAPGDLLAFSPQRDRFGVARRIQMLATRGDRANPGLTKLKSSAERETWSKTVAACQDTAHAGEALSAPTRSAWR